MRVGTRVRLVSLLTYSTYHPHACGDKAGHDKGHAEKRGSSPCVWGQGVPLRLGLAGGGIIPMRVGTSQLRAADTVDKIGSSPCVWGQAVRISGRRRINRIIPMRVGTRVSADTVILLR